MIGFIISVFGLFGISIFSIIYFINKESLEFISLVNKFKLDHLSIIRNKAKVIPASNGFPIPTHLPHTLKTNISQNDIDRFVKQLEHYDFKVKNKNFPFKKNVIVLSKSIQNHFNHQFQTTFQKNFAIILVESLIEEHVYREIGFDTLSYYKKLFLKKVKYHTIKRYYNDVLKPYYDVFIKGKYKYFYNDGDDHIIFNRSNDPNFVNIWSISIKDINIINTTFLITLILITKIILSLFLFVCLYFLK